MNRQWDPESSISCWWGFLHHGKMKTLRSGLLGKMEQHWFQPVWLHRSCWWCSEKQAMGSKSFPFPVAVPLENGRKGQRWGEYVNLHEIWDNAPECRPTCFKCSSTAVKKSVFGIAARIFWTSMMKGLPVPSILTSISSLPASEWLSNLASRNLLHLRSQSLRI